ncbi:MAG: hypothetical protein AAFX39_04755, partial [Pseudomonadota bacterium]
GNRVIRVDILERIADLIRTALSWRPPKSEDEGADLPPAGAIDGQVFQVTQQMTSLAGCSGEDFAGILKHLGFRRETRPAPEASTAVPASETTPSVSASAPAPTDEATDTVAAEAGVGMPEAPDVQETQPQRRDVQETGTQGTDDEETVAATDLVETALPPETVSHRDMAPNDPPVDATSAEHGGAEAPTSPPGADGGAAQALLQTDAMTENLSEASASAVADDGAGAADTTAPESTADADMVDAGGPAEPAAPAEPATIEVWRPRPSNPRGGRRPQGRSRRQDDGQRGAHAHPDDGTKKPGRDGRGPRRDGADQLGGRGRKRAPAKGGGKAGGKSGQRQPNRSSERPTAPEDSPFAALLALKNTLSEDDTS